VGGPPPTPPPPPLGGGGGGGGPVTVICVVEVKYVVQKFKYWKMWSQYFEVFYKL
jgi:hypothetical protein